MSYKIEFGQVKLGNISKKLINECLDQDWVTSGQKVKEFEFRYSELMQYDHVVAVNSGTSADFTACLCLYDYHAKPGDEIIVPALGFIAAHNSIIAAGFTPVPCDIEIDTLNINEREVESLITDKTVAIMAINTMGKPARVDVLRQLCDKHKLKLIIDNCEAHGCQLNHKLMSYYGDIVTYSFYAAHVVFGCQMGAVCTNDEEIANIARSIRTHGRRDSDIKFNHDRFGWNCQPNDLAASIAIESIHNFEAVFDIRRDNLKRLMNGVDPSKFCMIEEHEHDINSPHALSLVLPDDDEDKFNRFYDYLLGNGIHCKLNFKSVFTQQKSMERFGYNLGDFPEAEYVGRNGLHVPCHQYLTDEDIEYMIDTFKDFE